MYLYLFLIYTFTFTFLNYLQFYYTFLIFFVFGCGGRWQAFVENQIFRDPFALSFKDLCLNNNTL